MIASISLHGLYNFFIIEGGTKILVPIAIIINSAFFVSFAIKRLKKIKCYKGFRHTSGLPVRGQRTRSNFRRNRAKGAGIKKKGGKK